MGQVDINATFESSNESTKKAANGGHFQYYDTVLSLFKTLRHSWLILRYCWFRMLRL